MGSEPSAGPVPLRQVYRQEAQGGSRTPAFFCKKPKVVFPHSTAGIPGPPVSVACSSVPSRILSLQENPQATKKEEVEGADSHSDQRPESCQSPEQKGKEVSLDGSQYTPSPASQEDLESEVSDDSDQEVDIEGDKGYYTAAH